MSKVVDDHLGLQTIIHKSQDGSDSIIFESKQDVEAILNNAKARHNEGFTGSSDMKHAAKFPMILVDKYCNDHNITMHEFLGNKEHIRRMLNDPSLSHFRIWKGAV